MITNDEIAKAASLLSEKHSKFVCKELSKLWSIHQTHSWVNACLCIASDRKNFINAFTVWLESEIKLTQMHDTL